MMFSRNVFCGATRPRRPPGILTMTSHKYQRRLRKILWGTRSKRTSAAYNHVQEPRVHINIAFITSPNESFGLLIGTISHEISSYTSRIFQNCRWRSLPASRSV